MADYLSELFRDSTRNNYTGASTEEEFRRWAKPPSNTETEKCERAVRMIKQAIDADPTLSEMDSSASQGAYHGFTRIRINSRGIGGF